MTAAEGAPSGCRSPAAPDPPHGASIRRVLLFGFAVIAILWAICVYAALTHEGADGGNRAVAGICGLGVLLTTLIAAAMFVHADRLERRVRAQQLKDAQNARDLQRLSSRLVEAHEEERRNVARELHDEIGQALTAIKMELAHVVRSQGRDEATGPLESARAATDAAIRSVHDLTQMLHPRILDELGLVAALETHVREFSRRTGIPTDLKHDAVESSPDSRVALCAYRIVQEALTNVARHAAASRCQVTLEHSRGAIRLTVEDDGKGFDSRTGGARGGVGLLGIQERVAACGGKYSVETGAGKGTRMMVELPLHAGSSALGSLGSA